MVYEIEKYWLFLSICSYINQCLFLPFAMSMCVRSLKILYETSFLEFDFDRWGRYNQWRTVTCKESKKTYMITASFFPAPFKLQIFFECGVWKYPNQYMVLKVDDNSLNASSAETKLYLRLLCALEWSLNNIGATVCFYVHIFVVCQLNRIVHSLSHI